MNNAVYSRILSSIGLKSASRAPTSVAKDLGNWRMNRATECWILSNSVGFYPILLDFIQFFDRGRNGSI